MLESIDGHAFALEQIETRWDDEDTGSLFERRTQRTMGVG
jgi:hypothetical protein